jgi:hypothetical protein
MSKKKSAPSLAMFMKVVQKKKMAELWDNPADKIWETV